MKIPVTPPTPLRGLLPPLPGLPPALWQGVGTRAGSRITGDPSRQTGTMLPFSFFSFIPSPHPDRLHLQLLRDQVAAAVRLTAPAAVSPRQPPPAEAAAVHGSRRICNSGSGRFLTGFFGVFADFCTRTGPAGRS
ncbi:hypothetical protein XENOCAPTIV_014807 [Xenoophorus captivus]|uniref:Uncharacterized protein n=1 Tax=Xenoophorus captivus TaxID=1517983 RepID=A0ABV0SI69_9TELE